MKIFTIAAVTLALMAMPAQAQMNAKRHQGDAKKAEPKEQKIDEAAYKAASRGEPLVLSNGGSAYSKAIDKLVRILVPAEVAGQAVLRPGMSVVVKVNTKPGAPSPSQAMSTAALRTSVR